MPKINLLEKHVCELIAAGEVVERPSSVIKELVENSIDAGASIITVEIKNGGISYMRITDNGCGIASDDVPLAFLRHATSKISGGEDLNSISTLGFRGEALAAISSVSRVEMFTKTADEQSGTYYKIEGGEETEFSSVGCPDGTTIIIKDLFFNTPARMKFLKKDVSEGNSCAAVLDRIALSHPEISFKFIRDGKQVLSTVGDNNLKNTVYSVLGREFTNSLIELNAQNMGVTVSGLVCKPYTCKATRNGQYTFLNGRLVRSGTVVAAVEQAYKNSAMVGKFPSFVLFLTVPFDTVDVNVHPAKTEVRFSDEKRIFDSVYSAVKNALANGDTRPEVKITQPVFNKFERMTTERFKQAVIKTEVERPVLKTEKTPTIENTVSQKTFNNNVLVFEDSQKSDLFKTEAFTQLPEETKVYEQPVSQKTFVNNAPKTSVDIEKDEVKDEIIIIGEAFDTYIVAQMKDSIYLLDKHAAHERILFNDLKNSQKTEIQVLLSPVSVNLNKEEYNAIIGNIELLEKCGFEVEDFGNSSVMVRALPTTLVSENIELLFSEIAESLIKNGKVQVLAQEELFHTVACKAAIKAGTKISRLEMQNLAQKVLYSKEIMYCPHGRPVAFEIKKRELEKMFGRIQ